MRDRIGHQFIELLLLDHAAGDQRGDTLHRREQHEPDALGLARFEDAAGLTLQDQLEHHRERPVGGFVQGLRVLPVLAREHQLEQRGVVRGEADVCGRGRAQPRLEVLARALDRLPQLGTQTREPLLREHIQQRLAVGEVPAWRAVADADLARELAQGQPLDAVLANGALSLREQSPAQVAVVVGACAHRLAA